MSGTIRYDLDAQLGRRGVQRSTLWQWCATTFTHDLHGTVPRRPRPAQAQHPTGTNMRNEVRHCNTPPQPLKVCAHGIAYIP